MFFCKEKHSMKKRLFVKTKSHQHGEVSLNWVGTPEHEFTWYGEAFHKSGKVLVEQLKNNDNFNLHSISTDSFMAVPIVYMYRHAMELYLKGIIIAGKDILPFRSQEKIDLKIILNTHVLKTLLNEVKRIFKAFKYEWDFEINGFRSFSDFCSCIDEFDSVDPKSVAFRYPTNKDGKTASINYGFQFNLFKFCEKLDPIYEVLNRVVFGVYELIEFEYEQRAEARQYEHENIDLDFY